MPVRPLNAYRKTFGSPKKGRLTFMNDTTKANYVNKVFDAIAGQYDRMNLLMTWGMLPMWQKTVMAETRTVPGSRSIDVCCGSGEMAFQLAKRSGPFGSAIGLDFSDEMLETARHKQLENEMVNVEFIKGDALALPFGDGVFDAATNGFALRNVTDIAKTLQEMTRVVRIGGRVVCIEVSRPSFPLTKAFFDVYYFKVVPWLGDHLVSDQEISDGFSAYTWLAESLRNFPPRREIANMMKRAGLIEVKARPVGFGAVTIYSGTKPDPRQCAHPLQKRNPLEEMMFQLRKKRFPKFQQ